MLASSQLLFSKWTKLFNVLKNFHTRSMIEYPLICNANIVFVSFASLSSKSYTYDGSHHGWGNYFSYSMRISLHLQFWVTFFVRDVIEVKVIGLGRINQLLGSSITRDRWSNCYKNMWSGSIARSMCLVTCLKRDEKHKQCTHLGRENAVLVHSSILSIGCARMHRCFDVLY